MVSIAKKILAQDLRKQGFSISEIAERLAIKKSGSISKWCKNISLTSKQLERLSNKQKSKLAEFFARNRELKNKKIQEIKRVSIEEIGKLSKKDFFISGVAIYWCEGYKYKGGEQVGFTNSDPRMVLFMLKWFKEICLIPENNFSFQIKINEDHKDRLKEIERYWMNILNVPNDHFNKTVLIKAKTNRFYPDRNTYYGTLRITIRKSNNLRRKISGWIDGLFINVMPA